MTRSTPPAIDEFEVSIIGPGRGECVILHLGDNEWCIVDSCIPRGLSEAAAIEYLDSFQNGAMAGVRLIVATHWHDDHIRGLASILERVPDASFYCSQAIGSENFYVLAGTAVDAIPGNSGVEEFASILGLITENSPTPKEKRSATPKWAIENLNLLRRFESTRSFPVCITALSPSHGTVKLALTEIAKRLLKPGEPQRRIVSRSPNHSSIVLWVEAGPLRVLLGADLEHTDNPSEGWMAVLQCHENRQEAQSATLFKVPHHGSANADYPEIWSEMVAANPIAVVTPFNGGGTRLPQLSDLTRLATRTDNLYCTSAGAGKAPPRDSVVEKFMRQQVTERHVVEGQPGHVRVRWSLSTQETQPIVEVFHGAYRVP